MNDRRRQPTPWEAAQIFPPPRNPIQRVYLAARIRITAALTRGRTSNG